MVVGLVFFLLGEVDINSWDLDLDSFGFGVNIRTANFELGKFSRVGSNIHVNVWHFAVGRLIDIAGGQEKKSESRKGSCEEVNDCFFHSRRGVAIRGLKSFLHS